MSGGPCGALGAIYILEAPKSSIPVSLVDREYQVIGGFFFGFMVGCMIGYILSVGLLGFD